MQPSVYVSRVRITYHVSRITPWHFLFCNTTAARPAAVVLLCMLHSRVGSFVRLCVCAFVCGSV